jgi:hypothetical protein
MVGGMTLIVGSVKVTLRSIIMGRTGFVAVAGGSLVSGSDCVWESCLLFKLRLLP